MNDLHPYWPPDANLTDHVPNTMSVPALLGSFALATLIVISLTSVFLKGHSSRLSRQDKILTGWTMPRMEDLLGQLWKEYAKSDSRYLTVEPFVLCMETITAFVWGPVCYLTAWMIIVKSPYRHPTQMLVSMGQLYGDVLYYATICIYQSYLATVRASYKVRDVKKTD
ncbi:uncharacterized protein MYU51_000879 [Penicillium brevicompactum]